MATKTLKRFILGIVVCLLWASPAWATVTCYVTAGVTNCWLTGTGKTMDDVFAESYEFGVIAQPQSGARVWIIGNIDPYLQPNPGYGGCSTYNNGDGVTATDITSQRDFVYITDGCEFEGRANSNLTLGASHEGHSNLGSAWNMWGVVGGSQYLSKGGDLNAYGSMLISRDTFYFRLEDADVILKDSIIQGPYPDRLTYFRLETLTSCVIDNVYINSFYQIEFRTGFTSIYDLHFHDSRGLSFRNWFDITVENIELTDVSQGSLYRIYEPFTVTLLNPLFETTGSTLAEGAIGKEDYFVDVFMGNKDTNPESGVSAILYRNNLVTSGGSVFLCTTMHTGGDSGTTPVSGANWQDYWRVYFTGSDASGATEIQNVAGGDHRAGVSFYADDEVFNVLSGTSGYIAQQQVTFKKWSTSSEYLDTWLHELTLQKTGFETLTQSIYINEQKDLWYEVLDPATVASDVLIEVGKGHMFRRLADPVIVPLQ